MGRNVHRFIHDCSIHECHHGLVQHHDTDRVGTSTVFLNGNRSNWNELLIEISDKLDKKYESPGSRHDMEGTCIKYENPAGGSANGMSPQAPPGDKTVIKENHQKCFYSPPFSDRPPIPSGEDRHLKDQKNVEHVSEAQTLPSSKRPWRDFFREKLYLNSRRTPPHIDNSTVHLKNQVGQDSQNELPAGKSLTTDTNLSFNILGEVEEKVMNSTKYLVDETLGLNEHEKNLSEETSYRNSYENDDRAYDRNKDFATNHFGNCRQNDRYDENGYWETNRYESGSENDYEECGHAYNYGNNYSEETTIDRVQQNETHYGWDENGFLETDCYESRTPNGSSIGRLYDHDDEGNCMLKGVNGVIQPRNFDTSNEPNTGFGTRGNQMNNWFARLKNTKERRPVNDSSDSFPDYHGHNSASNAFDDTNPWRSTSGVHAHQNNFYEDVDLEMARVLQKQLDLEAAEVMQTLETDASYTEGLPRQNMDDFNFQEKTDAELAEEMQLEEIRAFNHVTPDRSNRQRNRIGVMASPSPVVQRFMRGRRINGTIQQLQQQGLRDAPYGQQCPGGMDVYPSEWYGPSDLDFNDFEAVLALTEMVGDAQEAGLSKQQISTIPHFTIQAHHMSQGKFENCKICWDDFDIGHNVTTLLCDHVFHEKCISKWLQNKATCPLCREIV